MLAGVNYFNQVFNDYQHRTTTSRASASSPARPTPTPPTSTSAPSIPSASRRPRAATTSPATSPTSSPGSRASTRCASAASIRQAQLDEFYHRHAVGSFTFDGSQIAQDDQRDDSRLRHHAADCHQLLLARSVYRSARRLPLRARPRTPSSPSATQSAGLRQHLVLSQRRRLTGRSRQSSTSTTASATTTRARFTTITRTCPSSALSLRTPPASPSRAPDRHLSISSTTDPSAPASASATLLTTTPSVRAGVRLVLRHARTSTPSSTTARQRGPERRRRESRGPNPVYTRRCG